MAFTSTRFRQMLGFEHRHFTVLAHDARAASGHAIESIIFGGKDGERIRGMLTRPARDAGRRPAILYAHAHGRRYDIGASELLDGRQALLGPLGPVFADAGYVTLMIDMPTFGGRAATKEDAASKTALWQGRTLIGDMLSDQAAALSWLASREDVDSARIGAFGVSMGATLSCWLAAIDDRIRAVAQLCSFADIASLVATGAHDIHGHYMTVPGLLAETSSGAVAGLVAPRPQLICVGEKDELTPPDAVTKAFAEARAAYEAAGAAGRLALLSEPAAGHQETPRMREAVLKLFAENL